MATGIVEMKIVHVIQQRVQMHMADFVDHFVAVSIGAATVFILVLAPVRAKAHSPHNALLH